MTNDIASTPDSPFVVEQDGSIRVGGSLICRIVRRDNAFHFQFRPKNKRVANDDGFVYIPLDSLVSQIGDWSTNQMVLDC